MPVKNAKPVKSVRNTTSNISILVLADTSESVFINDVSGSVSPDIAESTFFTKKQASAFVKYRRSMGDGRAFYFVTPAR